MNFINKVEIYICQLENNKYIPLSKKEYDVAFLDEIFKELSKQIVNLKMIEVKSEKLTFNQYKENYIAKKISKEEYKDLIYKRIIGMSMIEEKFPLEISNLITDIERKFIMENGEEIKIKILEIYVEQQELVEYIIDEMIKYYKMNNKEIEEVINNVLKYKNNHYILNIEDIVIKVIIYLIEISGVKNKIKEI